MIFETVNMKWLVTIRWYAEKDGFSVVVLILWITSRLYWIDGHHCLSVS